MIDVSMLEEADYAIVPNEYLAAKVQSSNVFVCSKDKVFSEYVLKTALEIINSIKGEQRI